MSPRPEENGLDTVVITYGIKELLSQINESVLRIEARLDTKASVDHVNTVEINVERLADRVAVLELAKAKIYGGVAAIGFLSGGGGYILASVANSAPS